MTASGLPVADLFPDPHPLFARLRREAPVWQIPGQAAYLVTSWALVAEASSRTADFSNHFRHTLFRQDDGSLGVLATGPLTPDVFAGADPPDHTMHRSLFFPELVRRRIATLEPYVTARTDEFLDGVLPTGRWDAATQLAHRLPVQVVAERVIGFQAADLDVLRDWVFSGARVVGGMATLDEMASFAEDAAALFPWIDAELDGATGGEGQGVLDAAAGAVRDGKLSKDEAAFTLTVLLGAGTETTTSLISSAVELLAVRRDLQDELRRDPSKIPLFVEEALRFDSPFRYHPRTATRDTQLAGVDIPEGALVLLAWASANRDEDVFDAPDEVRMDRPHLHQHFAFGRGIHHCVGAPLARLEARVVLERLLARTTGFGVDADGEPRLAPSVWVRRHETLPVTSASR